MMEHGRDISDLDPLDRFILVLQDRHRFQLVDSRQVYKYSHVDILIFTYRY